MSDNHTQRGSVLLYSLLIVSVMSLVAFVITSLSLREIKLAATFDDALTAFYAAESGVERSLDVIDEHRKRPEDTLCPATGAPVDLDCTLSMVRDFAPSTAPVTLTASNSDWRIDAAATTDTQPYVDVATTKSGKTQVDLYDTDDAFQFMNIESVLLLWNEPTCVVPARMEATYARFNSQQFGLFDDAVYNQVFTCDPSLVPAGEPYGCAAISNYPGVNNNYILRLKALDCDVAPVRVSAYDGDNGPNTGATLVPLPSAVRVVSVGNGNQTQRRMSASVRWRPSASGFTDFVLFSLERVEK